MTMVEYANANDTHPGVCRNRGHTDLDPWAQRHRRLDSVSLCRNRRTPNVMALAEGQADNAEANRWLGPYRGGGTPGIQRCPRQQQLAMSAFSMPEASLGEA
jgi:hypothetical protein